MQSIRLFCNARIHTNGFYTLIEAPYHVRFVIKQCARALLLAISIFLVPLFDVQLLLWYRETMVDWER